MKTRTKKPAMAKSNSDSDTTTTTVQKLEPSVANPPHVFILPKDTSTESRIVTLPNPATSIPSRYLVCPEKGWYEFTRVAAPKRACRSWLLAPDCTDITNGVAENNEGYVLQTPDLMVATPVDPLFVLLPALTLDGVDLSGAKQMFLALSDHLDILEEKCAHFKDVMQGVGQGRLERMFEMRIRGICDVVEAGEETLYRLSHGKLCGEIVGKAKRMVKNGLPPSMEERFVKRELAVPVLSIRREESSISFAESEDATAGGADSEAASQTTSQDTQTSSSTTDSVSTAATSITSISTPANGPTAASNEVLHLLRLRTALNFILASYMPPTLRTSLETLLSNSTSIDFTPLDKHLAFISDLKKQAQALRSMSDNISRKRAAMEDDDEALERVETKKRKKEEEEFRKKNMSRGVQQLKKADTSGMKKLSAFFTKAPGKKR